jgi:hypothetical protein
MPRPIGSGNIRPTQSELATLRKMTKALYMPLQYRDYLPLTKCTAMGLTE